MFVDEALVALEISVCLRCVPIQLLLFSLSVMPTVHASSSKLNSPCQKISSIDASESGNGKTEAKKSIKPPSGLRLQNSLNGSLTNAGREASDICECIGNRFRLSEREANGSTAMARSTN